MQFHILTLFPEMVENALAQSIIGRAQKNKKIGIETINIRDFANNRHNKVDDYTYGGGAGMLMQAQPVFDAYESVRSRIPDNSNNSNNSNHRVIYVTPQGHTFNQNMARELAQCDHVTILCGHYEGIDERVLEEIVTDYVSIGDYVLTGGELASMIIVDAVARLVPGVLHNDISAETESFHGNLLEYPQYSRPEVWHNKAVPQVLLSGNQKDINKWRLDQSVKRTKERRPDLYEKYQRLQECRELLLNKKLHHIDMIELINRGRADIIEFDDNEILIRDMSTGIYFHTWLMAWTGEKEEYEGVLTEDRLKDLGVNCLVAHQEQIAKLVEAMSGFVLQIGCRNVVYTQKERLSVTNLYRPDGKPTKDGVTIRPMELERAKEAYEIYPREGEEYISDRIKAGDHFGAFVEEAGKENLAGIVGFHGEGSIGILHVKNEYRGRKLGKALETYACNEALSRGWIPYGQVEDRNELSLRLQESLGLYSSKENLFWLER